MFGSHKKKPPIGQQPVVGAAYDSSPSQDGVGHPFPLGRDLYDLATDPASGWQVMLDPRSSDLTFFRPNGTYVKTDLRQVPPRIWTGFNDRDGKRMPLEIKKEPNGVFARWVRILGAAASGPGETLYSPEERAQAARDATEIQSQRHQTAMFQIYNIR